VNGNHEPTTYEGNKPLEITSTKAMKKNKITFSGLVHSSILQACDEAHLKRVGRIASKAWVNNTIKSIAKDKSSRGRLMFRILEIISDIDD
jgi:hypothetical protein